MAAYLCHEQPDFLTFDAEVVASRPGAVVLSRSAFYPGGDAPFGPKAAPFAGCDLLQGYP